MSEWPTYKVPWESTGSGHLVPESDPSPGEDWFTIADAYSDAAQEMVRSMGPKAHNGVVALGDAPEVLPALFLLRHFIELALKTILLEAGAPLKEVVGHGHDLKKLWKICGTVFHRASDSTNRYLQKAPGIEPAIDELVALDPGATGFRYPRPQPDKFNLFTISRNHSIIHLFLMGIASDLRYDRDLSKRLLKAIEEAFDELGQQEKEGGQTV